MSQENVEIARRMIERYNARDVDGCARLAANEAAGPWGREAEATQALALLSTQM